MAGDLAAPSIQRALREARKTADLTAAQAASRIGVAKTTYLGWERGDREIHINRLPEIADGLGVTIRELIDLAYPA